jgi:hypothetical protein
MSKRLLPGATLLLFAASHPATAQNLDWDKIEILTHKRFEIIAHRAKYSCYS